MYNDLSVFSGSASVDLTKEICSYIEIGVSKSKIIKFPDGESLFKIEENVRGKDCFLVQSTCSPVNDNLMELLIALDCLKRAYPGRITAVIPYFGYARQDRKVEGRTPISAKLVADLISEAGADRVLTVDLHALQIEGFFNIPVDHLRAEPLFIKYFKSLKLKEKIVLSADVGNTKVASLFAQDLGAELAIVHKRRINGKDAEATAIIGDVKDKDVLIVDDMISTAGTICSASELALKYGAKSVRVAATHGLFVNPAKERLIKSAIDEIIVTDTISLPDKELIQLAKPSIKILSMAQILGEAILRIHQKKSISALLDSNYKMYK